MKVVYGWKRNLFKADAQKVAIEIKDLDKINPDNIVEKAKDEKTELYKCFEWDDTSAAHNYRKQQARNIVNDLVIVEVKNLRKGKTEKLDLQISAYENITDDEDNKIYINILDGLTDDINRAKIFDGIKALLTQATSKFDSYNRVVSILLDK